MVLYGGLHPAQLKDSVTSKSLCFLDLACLADEWPSSCRMHDCWFTNDGGRAGAVDHGESDSGGHKSVRAP